MKGLLVLLALAGLSLAQVCPPAEVIFPCSCFESSLTIQCYRINEPFDLKGVFDNASQFVNDDVVFGSLLIIETSLVEIVDDAIEHLKFDYIDIRENPNLEYISPQAFNATRNVTSRGLDLSQNNFRNESNIFDVISSFEKLRQVTLEGNGITSIPDHAFQNLPFLQFINLQSNNISRIGSQAFNTGSENLVSVNFHNNFIPSGGLSEDSFDGLSAADFHLACNEMEFMEQRSFQTLLDRAATVSVGGNVCAGEGNIPRRLYCDERADWICAHQEVYRPKLTGFRCRPMSIHENIWDYCFGRMGTRGEIY